MDKKNIEVLTFKYPVVKITDAELEKILGNPRFKPKEVKDLSPGMCIGLAWTAVGGTIMKVETSINKGNGQLKLTGNLGEVMKESTTTALSWIKSNYTKLGINEKHLRETLGIKELKPESNKNLLNMIDIHIHFPAAATPKDGPSAGITIATALVSA